MKHRQNKNQRQRIVVFVGSPIQDDDKSLVKLGKKLKKNNVAVDIVNFGEQQENTAKLEAFIEAVNSSDNSHLVTVPPGPHILSDILLSSPIIAGEDGGAPAGLAASGAGGFEFGVDPNMDPELALALRISMEEERARQEAAAGKPKDAAGSSGAAPMAVDKPAPAAASTGLPKASSDEELAKALAMSMGDQDVHMADDDDAEIAAAIAMSMESNAGKGASSSSVSMQFLFLRHVNDIV